jgi:hypothetical protein
VFQINFYILPILFKIICNLHRDGIYCHLISSLRSSRTHSQLHVYNKERLIRRPGYYGVNRVPSRTRLVLRGRGGARADTVTRIAQGEQPRHVPLSKKKRASPAHPCVDSWALLAPDDRSKINFVFNLGRAPRDNL